MNDALIIKVKKKLKEIYNPLTNKDIISDNILKSVEIKNDVITLILEIDPSKLKTMDDLKNNVEKKIEELNEGKEIQVILTAHNSLNENKNSKNDINKKNQNLNKGPIRVNSKPNGVKRVIAIASGKGGVGKSTVASNLAVALALTGKQVAILDADVYGPSQPKMLGISDKPSSPDGKTIIPLKNHGVTAMSLGLMVPENQSIVWRGPMLMGALQQMLNQVKWGEQDYLFVDLPPGTGDVQLTLCQKTKIAGAIVVSTPQDIALLDARKGLNMFNKLSTPVIGLIENMSSFICSGCGMKHYPFNNGTIKKEAKNFNTVLLGELPLDLETREASDIGLPIVVKNPKNPTSLVFNEIANKIIKMNLD